jgi:hypothetical protein
MAERRFPPPWSAEVQPNCYVVRDANGQQLAYVYYSNEPDRRSAPKLLTKDEARRIARISLSCQSYCGSQIGQREKFRATACRWRSLAGPNADLARS